MCHFHLYFLVQALFFVHIKSLPIEKVSSENLVQSLNSPVISMDSFQRKGNYSDSNENRDSENFIIEKSGAEGRMSIFNGQPEFPSNSLLGSPGSSVGQASTNGSSALAGGTITIPGVGVVQSTAGVSIGNPFQTGSFVNSSISVPFVPPMTSVSIGLGTTTTTTTTTTSTEPTTTTTTAEPTTTTTTTAEPTTTTTTAEPTTTTTTTAEPTTTTTTAEPTTTTTTTAEPTTTTTAEPTTATSTTTTEPTTTTTAEPTTTTTTAEPTTTTSTTTTTAEPTTTTSTTTTTTERTTTTSTSTTEPTTTTSTSTTEPTTTTSTTTTEPTTTSTTTTEPTTTSTTTTEPTTTTSTTSTEPTTTTPEPVTATIPTPVPTTAPEPTTTSTQLPNANPTTSPLPNITSTSVSAIVAATSRPVTLPNVPTSFPPTFSTTTLIPMSLVNASGSVSNVSAGHLPAGVSAPTIPISIGDIANINVPVGNSSHVSTNTVKKSPEILAIVPPTSPDLSTWMSVVPALPGTSNSFYNTLQSQYNSLKQNIHSVFHKLERFPYVASFW